MRHYHGTPLGGTRDGVARFFRRRFAFVPFGRMEDLGCVAEVAIGFAFDNGAFSAWKGGSQPNWSEYFKLCLDWAQHPRFDFAVIPDIIDGTEADNRAMMTKWYQATKLRVRAASVWHLHESLDYLRYLLDHSEIVCLGSSGAWTTPGTPAWRRRMDEAMRVICDDAGRPRKPIHGLRMLNTEIIRTYPFTSADSTNVAQNMSLVGRFGTYKSSSSWQRAEQIAHCIEAVNSPAVYDFPDTQRELCWNLQGEQP